MKPIKKRFKWRGKQAFLDLPVGLVADTSTHSNQQTTKKVMNIGFRKETFFLSFIHQQSNWGQRALGQGNTLRRRGFSRESTARRPKWAEIATSWNGYKERKKLIQNPRQRANQAV